MPLAIHDGAIRDQCRKGLSITPSLQNIVGWSAIVGGVLCALLAGWAVRFVGQDPVLALLDWLEAIGLWGPIVFLLLEIVVVMLLLPGLLFTLGAGFLFGPLFGTIYVVIGHTLGGALAMITARKLFGKRMTAFIRRHPRLCDFENRLSGPGWKTIMLTRLVPFFPFKLSNYAFGLTGFRVRDFLIGTAIGTIPISATNVYAGSLAAELVTMDEITQRGPLQWAILGLGLAALLALVLVLGKIAQEHMNPNATQAPL